MNKNQIKRNFMLRSLKRFGLNKSELITSENSIFKLSYKLLIKNGFWLLIL